MPPIKKILLSCSTALATSTLIARTIEQALSDRGMHVITRQCKASELPMLAGQGYALVVSTTIIRDNLPIPVISAMPFLNGNDHQQVLDQITAILVRT